MINAMSSASNKNKVEANHNVCFKPVQGHCSRKYHVPIWMMIFFSLTCYKQVLVPQRRTPGPKVAGVKHISVGNRLLVSAAPAARGALGACSSGLVNVYIGLGTCVEWVGPKTG